MSVFETETPDTLAYRYWILTQGEQLEQAWPLNSTSIALENQRTVKSGAGLLFGIGGMSNKASSQFIQVFDTIGPVANGAVPILVFPIATVAAISVFYGDVGRVFHQGCVIANSSTVATLTLGAADTWFDVQYI